MIYPKNVLNWDLLVLKKWRNNLLMSSQLWVKLELMVIIFCSTSFCFKKKNLKNCIIKQDRRKNVLGLTRPASKSVKSQQVWRAKADFQFMSRTTPPFPF